MDINKQFSSFDSAERIQALKSIISEEKNSLPSENTNLNMHFHSFFSYNAEGYVKTRPEGAIWEVDVEDLLKGAKKQQEK